MRIWPVTLLMLLVALPVLFPSVAHSTTVAPMVSEIEPFGINSRTKLTIQNDSNNPVTIEASPWLSVLSQEGQESLTAADDSVIIFPPTMVIPAGKTQILQVQYVGDPEISESLFYRIVVEQLPIKLDESSTGVNVAFKFRTFLHVVPAEAKASLSISTAEPIDSKGNYRVKIENSGSKFASLQESRWTIKDGDKVVELNAEEINELVKANLILPNSSRNVDIKAPSGMALENATILISSE